MSPAKKFSLPWLLFLASAFLSSVILLPLFTTGLVADSTGSYPYLLQSDHLGLLGANFSHLPQALLGGISGGRIHFFFALTTPLWAFLDSFGLTLIHYRTLFFTLLSLGLWAKLLSALKLKGAPWLLLSLIFLPLVFQIRPYHDPFIVFAGSFQLCFGLFLGSSLFFIRYLQTSKFSAAVWALVFFSASAHSHEANIMLLPLMGVLFYLVTKKFFTRQSWPLGIMALSCLHSFFAASIWQWLLQLPAQNYNYEGTTINFSLAPIVQSWLVQVAAALPLNSFLGRTGQESLSYYPHLFFDNLPVLFFAGLAFGLIFAAFYYFSSKTPKLARSTRWSLILFGLGLWLLPALPVALSRKYQGDALLFGMKGGLGYVLVYYQYFGVALLAALGLGLIYSRLKKRRIFLSILTLICAVIFYLTYCVNQASVKQVNKAFDEWRFVIEQAQASGFFNSLIGQDLVLYLNHRDANYYQVDDYNRLLTHGLQELWGEKITLTQHCLDNQRYVFGSLTSFGECSELFNSGEANYFLYFDQIDEFSGYVILAPVTGFYQNIPTGKQGQIFYYSSYLNNNWAGGVFPALRRDLFTSYYVVDETTLELTLEHDRQWLVRDRQHNSTIIDFVSQKPILLDSLVPILIQDDRASLKLIAPVN